MIASSLKVKALQSGDKSKRRDFGDCDAYIEITKFYHMLKYPLTADVPEVVVYRQIITIKWFFLIQKQNKKESTTLFDRKWAGVLSRNSFPHI